MNLATEMYDKINRFLNGINFENITNLIKINKDIGNKFLIIYCKKKENHMLANLILSNDNIKLMLNNNYEFLRNMIKENTSPYTVHKFIMLDTTIGKYFGKYYIEYLFMKYNKDNIYELIAKMLNKKSIKNYPFIKLFSQTNILNEITILNVNGISRYIIYLLAIYYDYIWFYDNDSIKYKETYKSSFRRQSHRFGDFFWEPKGKYENRYTIEFYSYFELKLKRFYHPEYFVLDTVDKEKCYLINKDKMPWWRTDLCTYIVNIKLIKI